MAYVAGATLTADMLTRLKGRADPGSDDTFTTSVKVLASDTYTFTAVSTHTYKISYGTRHSSTTTSAVTMTARYIAGAGPITTTSTTIRAWIFGSTGANSEFSGFKCITGLSGQITIGMTGVTNTGTITVNGGAGERELLIEDLGL